MTTNTNNATFYANAHYVGSTRNGYHIEAVNGRKHVTIASFDTWDAMRANVEMICIALDIADAAA